MIGAIRKVSFATAGIASLLFLASATGVNAYVASGYYRPSGSVGFYLHNALVTVGWQNSITSARGRWNGAGASFTFTQSGTTNRHPSMILTGTTDGFNDIGAESLGASYVGLTGSMVSGTTITETDFAYNTNKAYAPNPNSAQYDVESVAVHELGHWLHLGETQSWRCAAFQPSMCPTIAIGSTYMRTMEADDVNGIQFVY